MIQQPDRYARAFVEAGADMLIVHLEAYHGPEADHRDRAGYGLPLLARDYPMTLVENTYTLLKKADQLLCMSVNPGFMGQPFIIEVLEKVRVARTYRDKNHLQFDISVDGGCDGRNRRAVRDRRARTKSWSDVRSSCPRTPVKASRLLRARANEVGAGG